MPRGPAPGRPRLACGTQVTGERIQVRRCDLIECTDGKISRKDSFWTIID